MATVYEINKGINRSLEFKGIKAQYIIYLALGLVIMLLLFAILVAIGITQNICLMIILPLTIAFIISIQRISRKYGEHGLVKSMAARGLPPAIYSRSRKVFIRLKKQPNADQ
jgi:hypothetical protein